MHVTGDFEIDFCAGVEIKAEVAVGQLDHERSSLLGFRTRLTEANLGEVHGPTMPTFLFIFVKCLS